MKIDKEKKEKKNRHIYSGRAERRGDKITGSSVTLGIFRMKKRKEERDGG